VVKKKANYWIRVLPDKDIDPAVEVPPPAAVGRRDASAHLMFPSKVDGDGKSKVSLTIAALPAPIPEPKGTIEA
jgi:hypothetical protein